MYNMNGAINEDNLKNMPRKKFMFYIDKLIETKKRETKEINEGNKVPNVAHGKMRYLGL